MPCGNPDTIQWHSATDLKDVQKFELVTGSACGQLAGARERTSFIFGELNASKERRLIIPSPKHNKYDLIFIRDSSKRLTKLHIKRKWREIQTGKVSYS